MNKSVPTVVSHHGVPDTAQARGERRAKARSLGLLRGVRGVETPQEARVHVDREDDGFTLTPCQ